MRIAAMLQRFGGRTFPVSFESGMLQACGLAPEWFIFGQP
jgi:hypothetical protein